MKFFKCKKPGRFAWLFYFANYPFESSVSTFLAARNCSPTISSENFWLLLRTATERN